MSTDDPRRFLARLTSPAPDDALLPRDIDALQVDDATTDRADALIALVDFGFPGIELDDDLGLSIRISAIEALGRLGIRSAIPALSDTLLAHDEDEVGRAAATALGALGGPEVIEPLKQAVRKQDPGGRWEYSLYALARLNDPEIDVLIERFADWYQQVLPTVARFPSASEIRERELWNRPA